MNAGCTCRLTVAFAGHKKRRFPTAGNGTWESADPFRLDRRDAPPTEKYARERGAAPVGFALMPPGA